LDPHRLGDGADQQDQEGADEDYAQPEHTITDIRDSAADAGLWWAGRASEYCVGATISFGFLW
jgi:hypothetical protein